MDTDNKNPYPSFCKYERRVKMKENYFISNLDEERVERSISTKSNALVIINGILAIIILVLIFSFIFVVKGNQDKINEDSISIADKDKEIKSLLRVIDNRDREAEALDNKINELTARVYELEVQLDNAGKENKKLYEDNATLLAQSASFNSELTEMSDRLAIYERYSYAMFNTEGTRNSLNYEYVKQLEDNLRYQPVNDIDFYLSWIMIESEGNAGARNMSSTAKGFSQFLDGTSKSVYNTYLKDKYDIEWYPNIVIDHPDICLDMMGEYVNYLYKECQRSIPKTIDCYRGLHDSPYLNKFNKLLALNGKSIQIIDEMTEKRYNELMGVG